MLQVVALSLLGGAGCSSNISSDGRIVRVAMIDGPVGQVGGLTCFTIDQDPGLSTGDHGTAVASVIVDALDPSCDAADRIRLGSFPVLDADGSGATPDAVAKALDRAIGWGADLVNVSIDLREGSGDLEASVEAAARAGVPIVAAAGNRMGLRAGYPAFYSTVIAVGASDVAGQPLWSSAVDGVDVWALGTGVVALDSRGGSGPCEGTSFAAALYSRALAASLH